MVVDTKLYDILGVSPNVQISDLKKAYRTLAKKHHPDRGGDSEKFKEIDSAYKVLSDEHLREMYDKTGSIDGNVSGFATNDLYSHLFTMGGFGNMFTGKQKRKTEDVVHELHVPLDILYTGKTKHISIKRTVQCKDCCGAGGSDSIKCNDCKGHGSNWTQQQNGIFMTYCQQTCASCEGKGYSFSKEAMCTKCEGKGHVQEKTTIEVVIPAGAPVGYTVTRKGLADEIKGCETGDVHFVVREKPHEIFTRIGNDLLRKVNIDLATALVGGIIKMVHIDGKELKMYLPRGKVTRYGDVLVVAGGGMPKLTGDGNGDLRITFNIDLPSDSWAMKVNESVVRRVLEE